MLRGGLTEISVKNQKHSQTQFNSIEKLINGPDSSQMGLLLAYICTFLMSLEGPLDCKEIQPVHSEGDQPWDFFGRNDAKAETPALWTPHAKS